jgi:signal transduction histidine kinase
MTAIGEILKEIELLYKEACESKSVKLKIKFSETLQNYKIRTDRGRIMQVLVNLINNSLKFTKEGGEIQIKFRID